jgi:hypothetical protein
MTDGTGTGAAAGAGGGAGGGSGAAGGGAQGAGGAASGAGAQGSDAPFHAAWEGLDDAGRDFLTGKGFKSPADLVKSAMLADKLVRDRNAWAAPDPKALDAWDGWQKLGWDPDAGKYSLGEAKLPEKFKAEPGLVDRAVEAAFVKLAHDAKIPPHQAAALRDGLLALQAAELDKREAAGAAASQQLERALKTEWGQDYAAKTDLAQRAARALGLDLDQAGALEKFTGAPGLVKMFARIGESLSEDTLKGGGSGRGAAMTPDQAATEKRRLEADPEFLRSLTDVRHPQHRDNAARRLQLQTIIANGR